MDLIVFGVNFKTTSIAQREAWVVENFYREEGVHGVVILATCNRVEIYAAVEAGFSPEKFSPAYTYKNEAAFAHLLKVVCGLDSMVLGETEVFGQVKQAYHRALELKTTGPLLNFVFQRAFQVAKKIRTETGIGRYPVSVGTVAILLLEQIFGCLKGVRALVVGLGEMGSQTAKLLRERGVEKLYLINRTEILSRDFAKHLGESVEAFAWKQLEVVLPQADVVITSARSPSWIFSKENFSKREDFQVWIDLGVPRAVDPAIGRLDGVYLYNVDDLKTIAEKNLANREAEGRLAEVLIQKQLLTFQIEWTKRVALFENGNWKIEENFAAGKILGV